MTPVLLVLFACVFSVAVGCVLGVLVNEFIEWYEEWRL